MTERMTYERSRIRKLTGKKADRMTLKATSISIRH